MDKLLVQLYITLSLKYTLNNTSSTKEHFSSEIKNKTTCILYKTDYVKCMQDEEGKPELVIRSVCVSSLARKSQSWD